MQEGYEYTVYSPRSQGQSVVRDPGAGDGSEGPLPGWSSERPGMRMPASASCADTSRLCAPWTGVWSDLAASFGRGIDVSCVWWTGGRHQCPRPSAPCMSQPHPPAWTTRTRRFRCRGAPSLGTARQAAGTVMSLRYESTQGSGFYLAVKRTIGSSTMVYGLAGRRTCCMLR
jgi:hypothetical protein